MTSYVNSYVEKTHLLRPPLGDVRNQPIKRLMAALSHTSLINIANQPDTLQQNDKFFAGERRYSH